MQTSHQVGNDSLKKDINDPNEAALEKTNTNLSIDFKDDDLYNVKLLDLEQCQKYTIRVSTMINGRTIASRSEDIEAVCKEE